MSVTFHVQIEDALRSRRPVWRLNRLIALADRRMGEAELIGWPVLAASWGADIQRIKQHIKQLKGEK